MLRRYVQACAALRWQIKTRRIPTQVHYDPFCLLVEERHRTSRRLLSPSKVPVEFARVAELNTLQSKLSESID